MLPPFAMKKVVINKSDRVWKNYQMELREVTTRHSSLWRWLELRPELLYRQQLYAEQFSHDIQRFDEPEDTLGFSGGDVAPGQQAEFSFIVSDMSPVPVFYLMQLSATATFGRDAGAGGRNGRWLFHECDT